MKDRLSCDIVRFKIEVGVDVKCTVKYTQNGHHSLQYRLQQQSATACRHSRRPDTTHTVGIVRSVNIHATARYSKICRSVCVRLCVCRKVYCGKTAEWIRMPFGIVSGVSRMVGVLDGVVIVEVKGQFWGEFVASHCNQWGLC